MQQVSQVVAEINAIDKTYSLSPFALDLAVDAAEHLLKEKPLSVRDRRNIANALRSKEAELAQAGFPDLAEDLAKDRSRRDAFITNLTARNAA